MNTQPLVKKYFLLPMWTAELAMLLLSALAIGAIMGWLPMQTRHDLPSETIEPLPKPAPAVRKELPPAPAWTGMRGGIAVPVNG